MKHTVLITYDPRDSIYIAKVLELDGCMAHGESQEEAMKQLQIAYDMWIKDAEEDGEVIPEPRVDWSVA